MNYIISRLQKLQKFQEYIGNIEKNNSPISISGLSDVGKIQYIYATKEAANRPICIVTYNELQARKIIEDLKFHLAKEKIVKENNIEVENDEMQQFAIEVARAQFAQYGMNNLTNEMLANYAQSMLQDEGTSRNMFDRIVENKVAEWIKEKIKLNEVEMLSKEFEEMLQAQNETKEAAEAVAEAIAEDTQSE